uniref:Uncharacterized protein n=1 Tax=Anguilla anguilla TaxID=7936 RepID=A0A0E9WLH6_ANGAN
MFGCQSCIVIILCPPFTKWQQFLSVQLCTGRFKSDASFQSKLKVANPAFGFCLFYRITTAVF